MILMAIASKTDRISIDILDRLKTTCSYTIFHGYISVVYIGGDPTAPVNSPSYIGYTDYNNQRDIVIDSCWNDNIIQYH